MKNKLIALGALLAASPLLVSAQSVSTNCGLPGDLAYTICRIAGFINIIIPILISAAVLVFIWGVIGYVLGGSEEAKDEGKKRMLYGLIGLLVIVSIWGIVSIVKNTFGITNGSNIAIPCIESPGVICPR